MRVRSGRVEAVPYSLSRWTDLPAAKWPWFVDALDVGSMMAFDPRDPVPSLWSLRPEDTLSLVFWTKDPANLIHSRPRLLSVYDVQVHMTLTGWSEVEKGAPDLYRGMELLQRTIEAFGPDKVTWRFSPIPLLPDDVVYERFRRIADVAASYGLEEVLVSFLQPNDLVPERRAAPERTNLLARLASIGYPSLAVRLCNDDTSLPLSNPRRGVCVPPTAFGKDVPSEACGCAIMIDPFTMNESCSFGCSYCYAADRGLSDKKRNTTRSLPVLR